MYSVAKILNSITGSPFSETQIQQEYKIVCPFHQESTPSFYMDYTGRYVCFGCGVHGSSLIQFICQLYAVPDYDPSGAALDALTILAADEYDGLVLSEQHGSRKSSGISLEQEQANLAAAKKYFLGNFSGDPTANKNYTLLTPGYSYLYKRGYLSETLRHFHVIDWQLFKEHPLFLPLAFNDQCWGYQQRRISESAWPKYLSMVGQKSSEHLDGYYPECARYCLVVEGPLDKMMVWQYGWREEGCVAILGSNVSAQQAALLAAMTDRVIAGFDMDEAGDKAYASLRHALRPVHIKVSRLSLPCQGLSSATKNDFWESVRAL